MKYIVATLFVALSTAALAQQYQKQYKVNPDSLAIRSARIHVNIGGPLYILDEKEISYDEFQKMDPDKLESITVLKDSTSTAPYGKKGINGVILIASKPRKKD